MRPYSLLAKNKTLVKWAFEWRIYSKEFFLKSAHLLLRLKVGCREQNRRFTTELHLLSFKQLGLYSWKNAGKATKETFCAAR